MLQEDKSKERGAIRLRVLHYVNESVLSWSVPFLQLLRALEDKGINNVVLCSPGGRLSKEVEKIGVECVVAKPLFPWCPRLCKIIGKKIADAHPDIILTRLSSAALIGGYWGKRLQIPVIGVLDKFSKPKYYRYVRTVQAVSSALAIFAKNAGMPDVVVIPNGIETSFYRPSESHESKNRLREQWSVGSDERIILAAGRFVEWKGFDVLLSAFADVHRRFLSSGRDFPFRLFLAGDGEEKEKLQKIVKDRGIENHIVFPGFVRDIRSLLQISDIFVLPSKEPEPFGLILLEAMASGVPSIATDCGGPKDMIEHGRSGWLVPCNDSESLAKTLEEAITSEDLGTWGEEAMIASKKFQVEAIAEKMICNFQRIIENYPGNK